MAEARQLGKASLMLLCRLCDPVPPHPPTHLSTAIFTSYNHPRTTHLSHCPWPPASGPGVEHLQPWMTKNGVADGCAAHNLPFHATKTSKPAAACGPPHAP